MEGQQLKIEGQAKALKRAGSAWLDSTLASFKAFLTEAFVNGQPDVTIDEFRARNLAAEPVNPNAWGSLPRVAVAAGYIKPTDRTETAIRPKAHARVVRVWAINPEAL